jgi:LruC domain-containing protein
MKRQIALLSVCTALFILSCKKGIDNTGGTTPPVPTDSTIAPDGFTFATQKTVSVNVKLLSNKDKGLPGVPVNIYSTSPTGDTTLVYSTLSDANGSVAADVAVPSYADTLLIDPAYLGLIRNAKAYLTGNTLTATIGGSTGYSGNIVESNFVTAGVHPSASSFGAGSTQYLYMGTYDNSGRPLNYMESDDDEIDGKLLSYLNYSLPEQVDVRKLHPQYIASGAQSDIVITKTSDVWITFVSEGAGYLNAVGFYTYPTGSTPKTPADIATVKYIFPNASLPGSGGNLHSGDKVKLGRFNAGTTIGLVIFSNGWNGKTVNSGAEKFYTDAVLNPETNPDLQRHTVLLQDPTTNTFIIGFEDLNRQSGSCDHDFNDVMVYATSNPVEGISVNGVQKVDVPKDSDGDGVTDLYDKYPNDPARAYVTYYPSQTTFASIAFEDLWPATGDYDMNDMVIGYRYTFVSNAQNKIVEFYGDYGINAVGASFVSGFGVQLPFSPNLISKVTGQKLIGGYIKSNANGTEAGQKQAVIIPFDNYQALIKRPGGYYINSQTGAPVIKGDTAHVYALFTSPVSSSTVGTAPFNPFLISNGRRAYEIHLTGSKPTDLADTKLFGTLQDKTNIAKGIYYVTGKNWPWAINFTQAFSYPSEGNAVNKAYYKFLDWAKSGGNQYSDWYTNQSGYRNSAYIYHP